MADAWIDAPGPASSQRAEHRPRAGVVALAVITGLVVLSVIVWVRFLSGVSAAPIPVSLVKGVPVVSAPSAATQQSAQSSGAAVAPTTHPQSTAAVMPQLSSPSSTEPPVDATWLTSVAAATGISRPALQAYAGAELELEREKPSCRLGWNTLAGIGKVESNNGRTLNDAGYSTSPILGPAVSGGHAEGPMQFMPGTWTRWGADGNGDGVADPNQIDDAALAAARYLCSYGDLGTAAGWHAAVFGYNHLESYVAAVAANATAYAQRAADID